MDDSVVIPSKRRKIDEDEPTKDEPTKCENGVVDSNVADNQAREGRKTPTKGVQLKPNALIERLRKITSRTLTSPAKKESSAKSADASEEKVVANGDPLKNEGKDSDQNVEKIDGKTKANDASDDVTSTNDVTMVDDVIISSTGSSPAHSPKPEDLKMLSTPPKRAKTSESVLANQMKALEKVSSKLIDRLDSPAATGIPVNATGSITGANGTDNEADRAKTGNSSTDERENEAVGGEADTCKDIIEPRPAGSANGDAAEGNVQSDRGRAPSSETSFASVSGERTSPNFNSDEFKVLLKQMIDEKFREIETAYESKEPEGELRRRILRLEEENRSLNEYAGKLEKAVHLLLENQKNKSERTCKASQTEVSVRSNVQSAMTHLVQPRTAVSQQLNTPSTEMKTRLTSSIACMPGHSVTAATLPQQAYPQAKAPLSVSSAPMRIQVPPQKPPPPYTSAVQSRPGTQNAAPVLNRPAPGTLIVQQQNVVRAGQPMAVSGGRVYLSQNNVVRAPQQNVYAVGVAQQAVQAAQRQQLPVQTQQRVVVVNQPGQVPAVRAAVQQMQQPIPRQQQQPPYQQQQAPAMMTRSPPVARPPQATGIPPQQVNMVPGASPTHTLHHRPPQEQLGAPKEAAPEPQPAPSGLPPGARPQQKETPPRPTVSIAVVSNGIVLSWNMRTTPNTARVVRYQLFALQDVGTNGVPPQWKKIGVVNALPLPMACTLTQFMSGNKYHFAVRALDEFGRSGSFSEPCTITLK